MKRRVLVSLTSLSLMLGACASDASSDADPITTEPTVPSTNPSTTLATTLATTTAVPATSTTTASTTTTTTSAVAETTTTIDPAAQSLVLTSGGIGTAEFGGEPEAVIGYVSSFLGEPTNDTGWIDPLSVGACPGTEIRLVDWGILSLVFGDASQLTEGSRHFFAYY